MSLLVLALLAQVTHVKCDPEPVNFSCRVVDGNCFVSVTSMQDAMKFVPPLVKKPVNIIVDPTIQRLQLLDDRLEHDAERLQESREQIKALVREEDEMKQVRDSVPSHSYFGAILVGLAASAIGFTELRNRLKRRYLENHRHRTVKQWIKSWDKKRIPWWRW